MTTKLVTLCMIYLLRTTGVASYCDDMASMGAMCPSSCTCCLQNSACPEPSLIIVCTKQIPGEKLSQQLNEMLLNLTNIKMKPLTFLTFSTAALNDIPKNICQLHSLKELRLNDIGLQTISGSCFTGMKNLASFVVNNNNLTSLPNDLFEGLSELVTIDFQYNNITDLQPELFLSLVNVTALKMINFSFNLLQSVDNWPLFFNRATDLQINFEYNNISKFTNRLNFSFICGKMMKRKEGEVSLKGNQVTHLTDLVKGWGFTGSRDSNLSCMILVNRIGFYFPYNPLICDCIDYDIYLQMKATKQMSRATDAVYCTAPSNLDGMQLARLFANMDVFICDVADNCPEGCKCENHPYQTAFTVSCEEATYLHLPTTLPALPRRKFSPYTYFLNLTESHIKYFETRLYLNQTGRLILSKNALIRVDVDAWKQLQLVTVIRLDHNQLTALPSELQQFHLALLTEIHLYGNPWSCDCHALWMKRWLNALGSVVINGDSILCRSNDVRNGTSILRLSDDMFVCYHILSTIEYIIIVVPSVFGACLLFVFVIVLAMYAKRHWLFIKFRWHIFDIDECDGEEMDYDAFVSYANEDEQNVMVLINMLEENHAFKVCYHRRDFQPGVASLVNMEKAITRSKRTVCFVTENFLTSEWCLWEFMMVLSLDLEYKRRRLIVIKDVSLDIANVNSLSIKSYLSSYTYIEYPSPYLTNNLLYWLPQYRLRQQIVLCAPNGYENENTSLS